MIAAKHYAELTDSIQQVAEANERLGYWDDALAILKTGLALTNSTGPSARYQARLQTLAARILWKQGDLAQAAEMARQARNLAELEDDLSTLAAALFELGEISYVKSFVMMADSTSRAIQRHREALTVRQKIGDLRGTAASLSRLGFLYEQLGQPEKASSFYQRSLHLSELIGDNSGKSIPLRRIAAFHERHQQWLEAHHYHQLVLGICHEQQDKESLVYALTAMGHSIYRTNVDFFGAASCCREGLALAADLDFQLGLTHALYQMAALYDMAGQPHGARAYYEQTAETAAKWGYQLYLRPALARLATLPAVS